MKQVEIAPAMLLSRMKPSPLSANENAASPLPPRFTRTTPAKPMVQPMTDLRVRFSVLKIRAAKRMAKK